MGGGETLEKINTDEDNALTDRGESEGVEQEGNLFNTLGDQISPIAVSWTKQVHKSTVVATLIIQSFILDLETPTNIVPFPLSIFISSNPIL